VFCFYKEARKKYIIANIMKKNRKNASKNTQKKVRKTATAVKKTTFAKKK
jgi:hypothetical protein